MNNQAQITLDDTFAAPVMTGRINLHDASTTCFRSVPPNAKASGYRDAGSPMNGAEHHQQVIDESASAGFVQVAAGFSLWRELARQVYISYRDGKQFVAIKAKSSIIAL